MADGAEREPTADERAEAADERATADGHARPGATESALAGADDSLVVWALASFHAATLTALLVAGLYRAGALGDLLAGLGTMPGLGLYLALWASTWWTTRRAMRSIASVGDASATVVVGTGGKWAGVDGVLFLWVLLVAAVVPGADVTVAGVAYFLAIGGVASLLAFVVGAVVGMAFAALDLALLRTAALLVPASPRPRERDDTTR